MRFPPRTVVLLLGATAAVPAQDFAERVTRALDRARPVLREHLRLQQGDVLALMCLAAAHDELDPTADRDFARALERLSRAVLNGTYGAALRLMVNAHIGAMPRRERLIPLDTAQLLANRVRGGFSYPQRDRTWDLSNSQYAALGLRAAAALGQPIDPDVWRELREAVLDAQADDGGFGYTKNARRREPYASMTVAGIAVLAICEQQLGAGDARVPAAIANAWKWMDAHGVEIGDEATTSCFYFHYGLERAAILTGIEQVDGRDWYRAGGEMLLRLQRRSGAWHSAMEIRPGALGGEGSAVDCAFAILFLRRNFRRELAPPAPITPGGRSVVLELAGDASDDDVRRAADAEVQRGRAALPDVLRALRSPLRARRRAAALAWPQLSDFALDYDPDAPPAATSAAVTAAEKWWLAEGRKR
jgi:hypothetical protein